MDAGEPDRHSKQFLLAEYEYFTDCFWRNEEGGEKRVQFFIALVTAVLGGLVALAKPQGGEIRADAVYPMAAAALVGLLLVGYVSLKRMRHRNRVTDQYKRAIDLIRSRFRDWDVRLGEYQPIGKGCLAHLPQEVSREDLFTPGQDGRVTSALVGALHAQKIGVADTATIQPLGHGWIVTDRDHGRIYLLWQEQGRVKVYDGGFARIANTGGLLEVVATMNSLIVAVLLVISVWWVSAGGLLESRLGLGVAYLAAGILGFAAAKHYQLNRFGRL